MLQKGQENFVILSPIEDGAKFHGVRRQLQFYVRGPKLMTIINFSRVIKLRNFELKQEFQKDFFTAKNLNFGGKIIIPLIVAIFSIIYVN
ncbi:hypothetical protein Avbf_09201 [Armadillidium vulgare]|nr:hypothetical protein Avbf_09201 [Armadillidium vulgare]